MTVTAAFLGSRIGSQREIALCVSVGMLSANMLAGALAFRAVGLCLVEMLKTLSKPVMATMGAGASALFLQHWLMPLNASRQIVLHGIAITLTYVLMLRWWAPHVLTELGALAPQILRIRSSR